MERSDVLVSMREDHGFHVRYRMEASCLELALEGERLCKSGDCQAGVSFFEAAVQVGTEDLKTLSAIYSQLGNAYFYLHEYPKALEYHHHDLTLARTIGDRLGEAKASGNLGNTLKVLGNFDEAIVCCEKHLDISREIGDKVGEARALYNLGNVYHSKGKHIGCSGANDPGEFPEEVKTALQQAADYYEANLSMVTELGDRAAQGRAYGNLGNTHYLLGNFQKAVVSHEQRLLIAKEFGDRSAERRAYSNLGNAFIFLGEFEMAAEYYKKTLQLARQLKDQAVEAQSCYSLGNTYTLLQDYEKAIDYHMKHLMIAQELNDRLGEGRACWSLGNAYTALGNHDQAMQYAERHLDISREVGDRSGELTARLNLSDLQMVLGLSYSTNSSLMSENQELDYSVNGARSRLSRRRSMESLELVKLTPERVQNWNSEILTKQKALLAKPSKKLIFVNRLKGKKYKNSSTSKILQDTSNSLENSRVSNSQKSPQGKVLSKVNALHYFTLVASISCRLIPQIPISDMGPPFEPLHSVDIQLVPWNTVFLHAITTTHRIGELKALSDDEPYTKIEKTKVILKTKPSFLSKLKILDKTKGKLPMLRKFKRDGPVQNSSEKMGADGIGDEGFFDLLSRFQSNRMDDQRCFFQNENLLTDVATGSSTPHKTMRKSHSDSVVSPHTDEFLDLLASSQSRRLDDQRASFGNLPGLRLNQHNSQSVLGHLMASDSKEPDDTFFDMLIKCQGSRLDDQRCALPLAAIKAPTVPDEDFFSLILRSQAKRMDEQRVTLPSNMKRQGSS